MRSEAGRRDTQHFADRHHARSHRRYRVLQGASMAALREDAPEIALHFQHAALDAAQSSGRLPAILTGFITRAAISQRLGESARAAADLDDAARILTTVRDPLLVSRNEARLMLARGETLARERPLEAIASLDKALGHFERAGTQLAGCKRISGAGARASRGSPAGARRGRFRVGNSGVQSASARRCRPRVCERPTSSSRGISLPDDPSASGLG